MQEDFCVGDWLIEPSLGRITQGARTVHLRAKVMDLLVFLAARAGHVASKDEILTGVWGTEIVSESALTRVVTELRQAFEDDVAQPRVIETIPKRGYRLIAPIAPAPERETVERKPARDQSAWRRRLPVAGAILAAIAAALVIVAWWATPASAPRITSLVVLPLENLSGDPEQQYFVDGMHEAIIGELSRIGPLVISHTSAMRYRASGKSVPEIARELKVDAVVEGSVQRSGGWFRITLNLVDAGTDRPIWTNSYERDVRDVLALQREVAAVVAREIAATVNPAVRKQIDRAAQERRRHHADPGAYDAYLKGRYHFAQFGEQAIKTAIGHYEDAVARDPAFAEGYAALALALFTPVVGDPARAAAAAQRALDLDPNLPDAYAAVAIARTREWDHPGSEAAFKRAIELDPNSSVAHQFYADLLRRTMRLDEALAEAQRAVELDPFSPTVRTMMGWVLFNQHRYNDAIHVWNDVLELEPEFGLAIYNQGLAYAMQRRGADVLSAAKRARTARRRIPDDLSTWLLGVGYALSGDRARAQDIVSQLEDRATNPGTIAILHHVLGNDNQAFDWLEKAYRLHWRGLPSITSEPWFDDLRSDPRFGALRAKMQLP